MNFSSLKTHTDDFIRAVTGKSSFNPEKTEKTPVDEAFFEPPKPRRFPWFKLFLVCTGGLIVLGLGMMAVSTVEQLFARHEILGGLGLVLFSLALLAIIVMTGREVLALMKLRRVTALRQKGETAIKQDNERLKKDVLSGTHALYARRSDLANCFDRLSENDFENLDTADRFTQFEKEVMKPLDTRARHIITDTAKRVSMLTAVSPLAALDVAFVCWQNMRMLHRLAQVYSGRPGGVETLKLAKMVLSHLALTGGIAMGDNLLQNLLGRGLAAKLSTRLGEGLANGILTSRVGLAALDLCRPLPFVTEKKPSLKSLIGPLISLKSEDSLVA